MYVYENILYFNEDSANVTFICNGMGVPNIDPININLDDTNYDDDDFDAIIHVKLLAWYVKFRKRIELKKELSE